LKIIGKTGRITWKSVCDMVESLSNRIIKTSRVSSIIYKDSLIHVVYIHADNPNHDMFDQLGVYYDMRYWRYYKRSKFLAGLSNYNDDEIVEKIEGEVVESTKERRKELEEFNIEKEFVTENISQLLLKWYPDLTVRELAVCHMIIWTKWDLGTPFYFELILRIVSQFMKLFFSLKHIQDTIQGLIHEGIIIPMLGRNDENDNPYIYLSLSRELEDEAYKAISG
jgi:hypothetical protein